MQVAADEDERRPRGTLLRQEIRMCWTTLSACHQQLEASMSRGPDDMDRTGGGVGQRSGRVRSMKAEGSSI